MLVYVNVVLESHAVHCDAHHHGYEGADVALLHDNLAQQEEGTFIVLPPGGILNTCNRQSSIETLQTLSSYVHASKEVQLVFLFPNW